MSGGPSTELIESLVVQFDTPFCTDFLVTLQLQIVCLNLGREETSALVILGL